MTEQNASIGALLDDYMEQAQAGKQVQGYLELQALMTFRVLAANQVSLCSVNFCALAANFCALAANELVYPRRP